MKAVVVEEFGPARSVVLRERPDPVAQAGRLLVDVHAMGVNFPDLLTVAGKYQNLPDRPFVPGKELAGRVAAVGAGVRGFRVGDRVMAQLENGAFAERVAVLAEHCFPMPDDLPMTQAAALGLTYQTAWFGLFDRAGLQAGETVVVTGGAGGVGSAALQLAKAAGCRVLAAVSTQEKRDFALELGADGIIDTAAAAQRDSIRQQVLDQNYGRGADVVIESVGGEVFDGCLRALAWAGRLVVVGFAAGQIPSVRANYLLIKHISVSGLHWSDYRERFPERMRDAQSRIFGFWREGRLDPPVTEVVDLSEAARALELIESRRALGKIVLETARGRAARAEAGEG
jgi:NADPH2:quinone reductase